MTIKKADYGEQYTKLLPFEMDTPTELYFLFFDQARTNLFWLLEPIMDTAGLAAAKGNPIAESIRLHLDATTRLHLERLPLVFLKYWVETIADGPCTLDEHWPSDYLTTMTRRAHEAQTRLLGRVEEGNVVRVNFRRRA